MKAKISALIVSAFASAAAFAGPYVITGDQIYPASDTSIYGGITYSATAPSTVTIEDGGTIRLDNQNVMNGITNTNKLVFTGGAFRHTNNSGWGAKYLTNYATDIVFDTDFTYEVATSSAGGPGGFLLGGGKWTFARDFNFEATGISQTLNFTLGYVSGGVGGTTTVVMGTNKAVAPESPEYSSTMTKVVLNNASELIVENNYQLTVDTTLTYSDTASTITNKGTFISNVATTSMSGAFVNSGSATFTKLAITGNYTQSAGSTSSSNAINVNSGGVMTVGGGSIGAQVIVNGGAMTIDGGSLGAQLTVSNGGVVTIDGGSIGAQINVNSGGTFTVNSVSTFSNGGVLSNSTLNINANTLFSWMNVVGTTVNLADKLRNHVSVFGDSRFNVLADDISVGGFAWKSTGSHEVSIALNGHDFSTGKFYRGSGCTSEDLFVDFILDSSETWRDNSVKVTEMSLADLAEVTFKINGVITDFNFVEAGAANSYYLNLTVPEPAEWAAIFGVIALMFAACRRRK